MAHAADGWRSGARDRFAWCVAAVVVLGNLIVLRPVLFPGDARLLRDAETAFLEARYTDAELLARTYLAHHPQAPQAWLIAGESAVKLQANERALECFAQIPDDGSAIGMRALYGRGNRLLNQGRIREAERCLRRVIEWQPAHLGAATDLTYLLEVEGRTFEALPYLWQLVRSGRVSGDHLLMAGSTESVSLREWSFVERCRAAVPEDPLPLLGRACLALRNSEYAAARQLLGEVLQHDPRLTEGQARLGRLLLDLHDDPGFTEWLRQLPPDLTPHPDIWVNRGIWARRQGQPRAAARCFWEAVVLHPNHAAANHHLSQTLNALGEKQAAEVFAQRAQRLNRVEYALRDIGEGVEVFQTVAQELEHLGRDWEAAAWYRALLGFRAPPPWAEPEFTRLAAQLISIPALTRPEVCPASQFDYSTFPLPEFAEASSSRLSAAESPVAPSPIRFENVAASAGIDFTFYNGYDPQAGRAYMFEFNGGGVAVLDYDHDGWPDLYFTQGARWPIRPADTTYRDRLYRNLGHGQFADVTDAAGLGDTGYSCGATVGDLDNDGWPDLYVGNIGPNRLYRNRGDGTFEDVTEASGTAGDQWTSSAVLADLNDDGLPDLYVTNYLAGPDVYEHVCVDQGRPVQCGPTLFRGEQDRLYVNLGDGRFADATETSGIVVPDGKGLGVLVADFDHSGKLGIFVANDTTANFFFRNVGGPAGRSPVFREEAMLSGVAFDEHGKAQSCMGIAAGDADGDGRLDMFVTNFYREPNALYVQQPAGGFIDQIRPAGMSEASFWTMGWGTQFLDADHDGWLDLILVNGHVNDFRSGGSPYQMPAQGFRNLGGGKFAELPASTLGPYFSQPYLGRALAVLDWNRDGRDDCCATHIDAPPALLENRTELGRHYLAVRLVGTTGERDAIGTRLELAVENRTWYRQLTAGDGFQASNERRIVFGLGEVPPATMELRVTWRGGRQDVFKDLPLDAEVILVEGSTQGHVRSTSSAGTVRP